MPSSAPHPQAIRGLTLGAKPNKKRTEIDTHILSTTSATTAPAGDTGSQEIAKSHGFVPGVEGEVRASVVYLCYF